ncbi:MAG: hypothetical protein GYB65_16210 [Chloroflexi bacterium]|nr:hypothetical protein [Chloroflexota bacterium]
MAEIQLTVSEIESAKTKVIKAVRKRMELKKPQPEQYQTNVDHSAKVITQTLQWARAFVPVVALLAASASAIRTAQTVSEIYTESGSHRIAVWIAAVAFMISAEGALFILALARENQRVRHIAEGKQRHVFSLLGVWQALGVRVGWRKPLNYDQMPQQDGLGPVLLISFLFVLASNSYIGLRPLVDEIGAASLQDFVGSIVTANAELQLKFVVDMAGVLFPPLMALSAGHLTARFAAEIAERSQDNQVQYERDLDEWRSMWTDPLATLEGRELLRSALYQKMIAKGERQGIKPKDISRDEVPMPVSGNGASPQRVRN